MRDIERYKETILLSETFYTLAKAHSMLAQALVLPDQQGELARLTALEFLEEAIVVSLQYDVIRTELSDALTNEVRDAMKYAKELANEG